MGLSKEQRYLKAVKNRRKEAEYHANESVRLKREEAARLERERLTTLGMLLGADYVVGRFIKTTVDRHGNRSYRFFNKHGVEIDRDGKPLTGEEGEDATAPS